VSTFTEFIPDVIDYIVENAPSYLPEGTVVLDGPPPTADVLTINPSGSGLTQRLWVGGEGVPRPGELVDAAEAQQGFAFIDQARTRDDQIEIRCAGEGGSGDGVIASARNAAFAVMAGVELMLRGQPGTSPSSPGDASMDGLVQWSEVTGPVNLYYGQQQDGAWARVDFRVSAFVRLTT
jgi:hypothetical protein